MVNEKGHRIITTVCYNNKPVHYRVPGTDRTVKFEIGDSGYLECFEELSDSEIARFHNYGSFQMFPPGKEVPYNIRIWRNHGRNLDKFLNSLTVRAIGLLSIIKPNHQYYHRVNERLINLRILAKHGMDGTEHLSAEAREVLAEVAAEKAAEKAEEATAEEVAKVAPPETPAEESAEAEPPEEGEKKESMLDKAKNLVAGKKPKPAESSETNDGFPD